MALNNFGKLDHFMNVNIAMKSVSLKNIELRQKSLMWLKQGKVSVW